MANREFFYFYTPTWDCPPDGPIKLGNVITSVKRPHRPISCSPPLNESEVFKTAKKTVEYTNEKFRSGKFSILTKFLSVLGLGVDIGAETGNSDKETFVFKTLESSEFIPTSAYLQTCIEDEAVYRFLQISRYRKPIYIITGLKIVTGAEVKTQKSSVLGGTLALEVDGTVWSGGTVPISVGPGVEGKLGKETSMKWEGSSDFVFAFRVSKVFVQKKTGQVLNEEEYQKGAMLGDKMDILKGPEIEVLKVQEPSAESEGFHAEILMDDEETVAVAVPREDFYSDD